jgi:hypothetical protein
MSKDVVRLRASWRLLVAAAVSIAAIPAYIAFDALRAVRQAREQVASAASLPVTIHPLDRALPEGVQSIGAPSAFRDAALFRGHLFVAGAQGMVEYDASGALLRRFRSGLELPPAGIVSITTGVLAAAGEPRLLIATAGEGLLTYDGQHLVHVRPEQADHRKLTAALVLASGRVLLGTEKAGVLAFDGRALTLAHPELANVGVTALTGTDGDVWIGTRDRGLWHWRAAGVERIDEHGGLPDPRVLSLVTTGNRTYAGTALGVAEFENGKFARTLGSGLFASAITVRQTDTLVIGTIDHTIAEIPIAVRASRGVRPLVRDVPAAIQRFVEADGTLYALAEDAIYAIDVQPSAPLRRVIGADAGQLTDRNISALAVDSARRLWVGYFDRGLDILTTSPTSTLERVTHAEDEHVFCINRIVPDATGGPTAVATANGLVLFDAAGRQKQVLGRREGLIADHVTDVVLRAGGMTIATPAGLTFIDRDGSRSLSAFHGLVNNHVYTLGASGTQILAGTLGGASLLDNGSIQASYTTANSGLTQNWITAVMRVDDEWIVGTYGGGVFRVDAKGRWTRFPDLLDAFTINPNAMAMTDTHLYAGTVSNGVLVFDRQARRWTAMTTGLPSLNVTAIAAESGGVYVGTDNGLVRLTAPGAPRS